MMSTVSDMFRVGRGSADADGTNPDANPTTTTLATTTNRGVRVQRDVERRFLLAGMNIDLPLISIPIVNGQSLGVADVSQHFATGAM
jgi:hypothetical protein